MRNRGTVQFPPPQARIVEELRSGGGGSSTLLPFNWIPFRNHLTSELVGASDILSGAWPFLALAFVVSGWRLKAPRGSALVGAVLVFSGAMALEWVQRFLPGRSPDVTDALIARRLAPSPAPPGISDEEATPGVRADRRAAAEELGEVAALEIRARALATASPSGTKRGLL
jgi:hypothetical protein